MLILPDNSFVLLSQYSAVHIGLQTQYYKRPSVVLWARTESMIHVCKVS